MTESIISNNKIRRPRNAMNVRRIGHRRRRPDGKSDGREVKNCLQTTDKQKEKKSTHYNIVNPERISCCFQNFEKEKKTLLNKLFCSIRTTVCAQVISKKKRLRPEGKFSIKYL